MDCVRFSVTGVPSIDILIIEVPRDKVEGALSKLPVINEELHNIGMVPNTAHTRAYLRYAAICIIDRHIEEYYIVDG